MKNDKMNKMLLCLLCVETILLFGLFFYTGKLRAEKKKLETMGQVQMEETVEFTEDEIRKIATECFDRYRIMEENFFMSFLTVDDEEEPVTINGVDGYMRVTDERYSTVQNVKDYVESICTKEYAEELYENSWKLNGERPVLAELDGKLYTQLFDSSIPEVSYSIPVVSLDSEGDIVFVYQYVCEEDGEEWTENGTVALEEQDGKWYISNVDAWK